MFARTGSQGNGAERKVPMIQDWCVLNVPRMGSSTLPLSSQGPEDRKVFAFARHLEPANFVISLLWLFALLAT